MVVSQYGREIVADGDTFARHGHAVCARVDG